jgi:hypothetical protein
MREGPRDLYGLEGFSSSGTPQPHQLEKWHTLLQIPIFFKVRDA